MRNLSRQQRTLVATFLVAGAAAIVGEHFLKPTVKRKLKI